MFSLHTQNHLQTLLAKIQAGVLIHDQALVEAEKINKLDLKKAPKVKDKDSEAKPHEQDNPVDDEEHRCATDDMGMQNPDKMPKDKDREDVVVQLEGKVKEGRFTRMASTDEQEQAIQRLETALQKLGKRFVGGTTIGKDPQRVVLDLKYQGSEVRVDSDGQVEINNQPLDMDYDDESLVEELKGLLGGERNHQTEEASVKSSGARVAQLESKTNEAATGRDLEGFVRFATAEEAFLWEDEILGQLSDGAWENATPHDHWQAWGRAGVEVGSPAGYYGFRPKRTSYGLNSLIEYIGDRMQTHLGLMRILKAKGVNPDEFKHNLLPDDPADFDSTVKYAQGDAKNTDTKYWAEKLQKWQDMGITREMVVMAKEKTSETDLRKVLRGIQKTIKIRLPDAGPEKGPELEKEPELKKEEPKVTRPEKVDLLAPGRKKPETPRGEPGAKKFPTFSKEGKIPSKPSEAGEEETKKALKEEDQSWDVFDRLEGLANQKRLKQLGSLVQELLNDFTDEGLEAEDVEEYLFGKVKDIITSQGLAGRKIEGKAPISTDTPEQAKKKLMEEAPAGVDAEQLTMGIKVEMEHTDKPEEAKKIALDHLAEDPKYYTKLKKMEAGKCDDVQLEEAFGPEEEQYKVSEEDLAVLSKAVKAGKLKNAYPSEEDMIDQLSSLEDIVDPATAEEGDVRLLWLKYVQIPKAYALTGPVTAKKSSGIPSAKNLDKQWDSAPYPHKNEAVIGPTFEAETLLKEVLFAMKKYGWNYEEAVKGFAAKNDMDPEELEHLLSKAIETESSSDQPVKEQEEVQYVSVADGILDKKTADDLAVKIKGTVATDDNDPKKFKVITRKDSGTV